MIIEDLLYRQKENNKVALIYKNRKLTFREWYLKSLELSKVLRKCVEKSNQNIGLFLPNSIEYAISYFGILFSKNVIVPFDIHSKSKEFTSTLEYCDVQVIITKSEYESVIHKNFADYPKQIIILFVDTLDVLVINQNNKKLYKKAQKFSNDLALLLHTSGTTSNPKRVMLTNLNIITNIESNISSLNINSNEIVLIALPMYFGYCNTAQFLTYLYLGGTIVIYDGLFIASHFFKLIEKESITSFTAVPTMLNIILKYRFFEKYNLNSLKYISFGGGKIQTEILKQLLDKFPKIGFIQTYGQTEASPRITTLLPQDQTTKFGSVGKCIPGVRLKIVDEQNQDVAYNVIGNILVQGDNVTEGYYKNPEASSEIIENGWLNTGDIGYMDSEGYLFLKGRKKNIIISGGINIYPEEIEEILLNIENVENVVVKSKKDINLGEVPIALIKVYDKNKVIDFYAYCESRISKYKIPKEFILVDIIEQTYNGKNKRNI